MHFAPDLTNFIETKISICPLAVWIFFCVFDRIDYKNQCDISPKQIEKEHSLAKQQQKNE